MTTFTCDRCGREFDDGIDAGQHEMWHARKDDAAVATAILAPLPEGATFKLTTSAAGRAYAAIYRKNAEGYFDQVFAPEAPLVRNMSADHLGFCVGSAAILAAVAAEGVWV